MFIKFFETLREKGLRVTLGEWLTFQEALDKGLCGSSLTQFYYTARMILVKSETDFDKFDMAFDECFKAAQRETEVGKEMLRWLDKSDMMELAHEEARDHMNKMEDLQIDKEDVEEKFRRCLNFSYPENACFREMICFRQIILSLRSRFLIQAILVGKHLLRLLSCPFFVDLNSLRINIFRVFLRCRHRLHAEILRPKRSSRAVCIYFFGVLT